MNGGLAAPFLTKLDSRARIKGSRDALGCEPLWSDLGRRVVGNLTTQSSSLRGFITLLVGHYMVERLREDTAESDLARFLKFEQLAAYARAHHHDTSFRGVDRVSSRLSASSRVTISADPVHQILSDQRAYGLWGLYKNAALSSGLLEGTPTKLTPQARSFVEATYLRILEDHGIRDESVILRLLTAPRATLDLDGRESQLVQAIAAMHGSLVTAFERSFFTEHLAWGGPEDSTGGQQRILADLLVANEALIEDGFSIQSVRALATKASRHGDVGRRLAENLGCIASSASVFVPATRLFSHLLASDGVTTKELTTVIARRWGRALRMVDYDGFRALHSSLRNRGESWLRIGHAFASGEYETAIHALIQENAEVMKVRGGAPWLELTQGRLHVRYREAHGALPDREQLAGDWVHPYFLDSLEAIVRELRER